MEQLHKRKGQMDNFHTHFYTEAIFGFQHLLADDSYKMIVINSLKFLVEEKRIDLFGYVIMPNHIHLLWRFGEGEWKESPAGNFNKFTSHAFKKHMKAHSPQLLSRYRVGLSDRNYQFWERDALAIPMSTERILQQKLNYIHNNPVREKWQLAKYPEDYRWSSAAFYKYGFDEFGILRYWWE
jgi:putative transposase